MDLITQEKPLQAPFPTLPHWSENYCLSSFDPKCGVGLWLHLGRWRKDLSMWRETVVVTWPDGSVSGYRAYGHARAAEDGPGGPNYAVRVLEPGKRLSYSFLGGVQRVPSAQMQTGLQVDGPRHRLAFELEFASNAGIWDLHKVGSSQEFLGTGHIEQIGRVAGQISIGDESYSFNSHGNRDHSMGPRDTPTLGSHQWLQGYFENGKSFLVYDAVLRGSDAPVFCQCAVYDGDRLLDATLAYPWRIQSAADATRNFGFSIAYDGSMLDIHTAGIQNTAYLSFTVPNDHYIGVYPAGNPPLTLLEQPTLLTLADGTKGFGWLERTVPGRIGVDG